jgi:hypothetical protein
VNDDEVRQKIIAGAKNLESGFGHVFKLKKKGILRR